MARRELMVLFFWSWYKRSLVANLQFSFSHVNAPVRCKFYSFCKRKFRHFREPTDKMHKTKTDGRLSNEDGPLTVICEFFLTNICSPAYAPRNLPFGHIDFCTSIGLYSGSVLSTFCLKVVWQWNTIYSVCRFPSERWFIIRSNPAAHSS